MDQFPLHIITRIVLLMIMGGVIGWGTNWLAIKMLFRPRQPRRVLGLSIQGLLPKRRPELAHKVSQVVADHLITTEDQVKVLSQIEINKILEPAVDKLLDRAVEQNLPRNTMLPFDISAWLLPPLKRAIYQQLPARLKDIDENLVEKFLAQVKIADHVEERIQAFELEKLEHLTYAIARRELRAIELYGAVLGMLLGLVQGLITLWL